MVHVKRAALAGQWYPADPESLEREVRRYIDRAQVPPAEGHVLAVLSPHAGYAYSGPVAGFSFRALQGSEADVVVLIAVCHSGAARASILDSDAYETSLGRVEIDRDLVTSLQRALPSLAYVESAHFGTYGRPENSAELQVPFIQTALPGTRLVEILIGGQDKVLCEDIGNGLAEVLRRHPDKRVVFVASSDMSHYPAYEDAQRVDQAALQALATLDEEHIRTRLRELESEPVRDLHCVLCGAGAVLVTVRAAKELGADRAEILHYRNSGDAPFGSKGSVVGYGALALYGSGA